ncbi:unnamed protein product, partial [Polarella glacialis]
MLEGNFVMIFDIMREHDHEITIGLACWFVYGSLRCSESVPEVYPIRSAEGHFALRVKANLDDVEYDLMAIRLGMCCPFCASLQNSIVTQSVKVQTLEEEMLEMQSEGSSHDDDDCSTDLEMYGPGPKVEVDLLRAPCETQSVIQGLEEDHVAAVIDSDASSEIVKQTAQQKIVADLISRLRRAELAKQAAHLEATSAKQQAAEQLAAERQAESLRSAESAIRKKLQEEQQQQLQQLQQTNYNYNYKWQEAKQAAASAAASLTALQHELDQLKATAADAEAVHRQGQSAFEAHLDQQLERQRAEEQERQQLQAALKELRADEEVLAGMPE